MSLKWNSHYIKYASLLLWGFVFPSHPTFSLQMLGYDTITEMIVSFLQHWEQSCPVFERCFVWKGQVLYLGKAQAECYCCVCTWEFIGKFSNVDHSLWSNTQITCCYGRSGLYGIYGTLSLTYTRFTPWILLYYWDLTLILWWWEGAILLLWNPRSLLLLLLHLLGGWEQLMLSCHLLPLWRGK